jgi:hypothetical protein
MRRREEHAVLVVHVPGGAGRALEVVEVGVVEWCRGILGWEAQIHWPALVPVHQVRGFGGAERAAPRAAVVQPAAAIGHDESVADAGDARVLDAEIVRTVLAPVGRNDRLGVAVEQLELRGEQREPDVRARDQKARVGFRPRAVVHGDQPVARLFTVVHGADEQPREQRAIRVGRRQVCNGRVERDTVLPPPIGRRQDRGAFAMASHRRRRYLINHMTSRKQTS